MNLQTGKKEAKLLGEQNDDLSEGILETLLFGINIVKVILINSCF